MIAVGQKPAMLRSRNTGRIRSSTRSEMSVASAAMSVGRTNHQARGSSEFMSRLLFMASAFYRAGLGYARHVPVNPVTIRCRVFAASA